MVKCFGHGLGLGPILRYNCLSDKIMFTCFSVRMIFKLFYRSADSHNHCFRILSQSNKCIHGLLTPCMSYSNPTNCICRRVCRLVCRQMSGNECKYSIFRPCMDHLSLCYWPPPPIAPAPSISVVRKD